MISSADRRSFSLISYELFCAVREAGHGNAFMAGRSIGKAWMAAGEISDDEARARTEWLVEVLTTVAQQGHAQALKIHRFDSVAFDLAG